MSKDPTIKDLSQMIKRQTDSMNQQFKAIDKQFKVMNKRFDSVENKIKSEIEGLATMTQNGFNELEKKFEKRVNDLENKLEQRFETIEAKIGFIEHMLDQIKIELDELLKGKTINENKILTMEITVKKLAAEIEKLKAVPAN